MSSTSRSPSIRRRWKAFTRGLRPALGNLGIRLFGRLSIPATRRLGSFIGRCTYRLGGKTVNNSRENLRRCFPELSVAEREALLRQSLTHTGMTALEAFVIWRQPWETIQSCPVSFDQFDLVVAQQQTGRGLLLLAPHLGNWEIMGPIMPRQVGAITFMYQPTGMEEVDQLMIHGRSKDGVKLAPANRQGVGKVLRALKAGEMVSILPDQVPEKGGGLMAPFFGQPAYTMTLVHKLIQRTDCDVLMIFARRTAEGFVLCIRNPDPAIKDANAEQSLAALNRSVEACVREVPEQYQWEYKRFKGAS